MSEQLTKTEATDYADRLQTIRGGMRTVAQVVVALRDIRDRRLYREKYETFEDFVDTELRMSLRSAYRLLESADVEEELTAPDPAPVVEVGEVDLCQIRHKGNEERQALTNHASPPKLSQHAMEALAAAAPKGERKALYEAAAATAAKDRDGKPKVTAKQIQKVAATRKAPAPEAKPEPAKPAAPGVPHAAESAAVDALLDYIESQVRQLSKLLDANKAEKKCRAPFAHFVPYLGGVGAIAAGVDTIRQNLPGAADPTPPGYIPRRSVKQRADYAKGGK